MHEYVEKIYDYSKDDITIANTLITHKRLDILKIFIMCGLSVRNVNLNNYCNKMDFEVIKFLIENGCNVNHINYYGTPLHNIVNHSLFVGKNKEICSCINLMMKNGVDINKKNIHGSTALDVALMHLNYEAFAIMYINGFPQSASAITLSNIEDYEFMITVILFEIREKIVQLLCAGDRRNNEWFLPFPVDGGHIALHRLIADYVVPEWKL
jgi:ankyrin repeat protein